MKVKGRLKLFRNAGFNEPVFKLYRKEINTLNRNKILGASFIGMIILFALAFTSIFVKSISKVFPLYVVIAILFMVIYLGAKYLDHRNPTITLILFYAFFTNAFSFAIALDAIQNNPTATTVCVLLVALPLLLLDRPLRQTVFFTIIAGVFIFEATCIKTGSNGSIDVVNAFCFLTIGIYLGYLSDKLYMQNIINSRLLENQRDTDTLTTLYNKGAMENKAVHFLTHKDVTASLMVIDLDNFKYVNDTYGHKVGDYVLSQIGEVLTNLFRSSDLVSRFGGDEFLVFLPMCDDQEFLANKAQAILDQISEIKIEENPDYRVNVCIGISIYPRDGTNYEELFQRADHAMYEVKKNGKGNYMFYK